MTTPQKLSLVDVVKGLEMFRKLKVEQLVQTRQRVRLHQYLLIDVSPGSVLLLLLLLLPLPLLTMRLFDSFMLLARCSFAFRRRTHSLLASRCA